MPEELRQEVSEQNRIRLEKLRALQAEGRDPTALPATTRPIAPKRYWTTSRRWTARPSPSPAA